MDYFRFLNDCRPEYPAFRLDAVPFGFSALASKVFSIAQVEKILYIRVHPEIAKQFELDSVTEIKEKNKTLSKKACTHDTSRIWYKFDPEYLNLKAGYHQYRMEFTNITTGDACQLYFAYTIQDNDPEKPYYYMENARKYLDTDTESEEDTETETETDSDTESDTETDTE